MNTLRPLLTIVLVALTGWLSGCQEVPSDAAEVTRVIDGDTIEVRTTGGLERVRIIGIDTPEMDWETHHHDCYAAEAGERLSELLDAATVTLRSDASQGDRDRFDRLLRHVDADGVSVALTLIEEGYGVEYTYDLPYAGQRDYRDAHRHASSERLGLWGACRG